MFSVGFGGGMGLMFYKISNNIRLISRTLSYTIGGLISLILSYIMALLLFKGTWFYSLPIVVLALVFYAICLALSNKYPK